MNFLRNKLIDIALEVRSFSHSPYSNKKIGSAIQLDNGKIYSGCNIENASYGATVCAERVAIFKGVSEGLTRFTAVAVVTDVAELTPPCGACRQLLWEFAPDATVTLANTAGRTETFTVRELLPRGFDASQLGPVTPS